MYPSLCHKHNSRSKKRGTIVAAGPDCSEEPSFEQQGARVSWLLNVYSGQCLLGPLVANAALLLHTPVFITELHRTINDADPATPRDHEGNDSIDEDYERGTTKYFPAIAARGQAGRRTYFARGSPGDNKTARAFRKQELNRMAGFDPEPIWVQHQDQFGRVYWRHRVIQEIRWEYPMFVGQQFGTHPPPYGPGVGQYPQMGLTPFGQPLGAHLPAVQAVCTNQPFGLAFGMHPNIIQPCSPSLINMAIAEAWQEYSDKNKKKYWHNTITKKTTWDDPKAEAKTKSPPPPPPPPQASPPKFEKREQDQWHKVKDGKGSKIWIHEKTGATQYGVPDCRQKYR